MADRYPLVVDSSNYRIEEVPSGDNINLNGNSIVNAVNVSTAGVAATSVTVSGTVVTQGLRVTGILTADQNISVEGLAIGIGTFSGIGVGVRTTGDPGGEVIIPMQQLRKNVTIGSTMGANISGYANIAIGENALGECINARQNIAIGVDALRRVGSYTTIPAVGYGFTPYSNTFDYKMQFGNIAIGQSSGRELQSGYMNVLIGNNNMMKCVNGTLNICLGDFNLTELVTGSENIAIGHAALAYGLVSGRQNIAIGVNAANTLGFNTCTHIGHQYNAITGDLQVQLNSPQQTVYTYNAVQTRSDERDKADIRDTVLGLDFINQLRPVDWKWDYRDFYNEVTNTGEVINHPKDGSKKRNRYHHGLIAQEVKAVIDQMGVDFGGYQDHTVNGGYETMTIGYEELIAPMIKAIQELTARVESLENA